MRCVSEAEEEEKEEKGRYLASRWTRVVRKKREKEAGIQRGNDAIG